MATILSSKDAERRRFGAMTLMDQGWSQSEVVRHFGVTPAAVCQWVKAYQRDGPDGLKARVHPGAPRRLAKRQLKRLEQLLLRGPTRQGYPTELWTLLRVVAVIRKYFGVSYDPSGVWHILHRMGWSCQKPERRVRQRDEQAIGAWRKRDWPRIKKHESGKTIVFVDENGFMLQLTVRRTWAPKGQTPIHYSWDRRDRISSISALTLWPQRHRVGLYFELFDHNITAEEAEPFVAALLDHFAQGIILVWDRWSVHRSAKRCLLELFPRRLEVKWLPSYAPDLNPVEQVWNRAKYADLANFIPEDVEQLSRAIKKSLRHTRSQQTLLCSFFK